MKSAIVRTVVVPTAEVLSLSDKVKVRAIVGAGLDLPVSIARNDFESMYEKAATMPLVMTEFVHVRVSRRKNSDGFAITEDIVTTTDNEVADEAVSFDTDDLDSFVNEALGNMNEEPAQEIIAPVITQEPKKLSAVEQALMDMQAASGARLAPVITPMAVVTNKPEVTMPINELANAVSNSIHTEDADLDFVTFVYNKAIVGKYPKWTQNITVTNVGEYAKLKGVDVHTLVRKYLVAHPGKKGGIAYYSLKAEFVVKYYDKACYASPDRKWFVVVLNGTVELYRGDSKENKLVKTVVASEAPEQYAKAIATLEGYTFRQGVWGK